MPHIWHGLCFPSCTGHSEEGFDQLSFDCREDRRRAGFSLLHALIGQPIVDIRILKELSTCQYLGEPITSQSRRMSDAMTNTSTLALDS